MTSLSALLKSTWEQLLIATLGSAVSTALYIWALKQISMIISAEGDQSMHVFLLIVILVISSTVIALYTTYHFNKFFERKTAKIREDAATGVLEADFETVESIKERIVPILNGEINSLTSFTKNIPNVLVSSFKVLGIWIYMITLDWKVSLAIIAVFGFVIAILQLILPVLMRMERKLAKLRQLNHRNLRGVEAGLKDLFLHTSHRKVYVNNVIRPTNREMARQVTRVTTLNSVISKTVELLILIGVCSLVLLINSLSSHDHNLMIKFLAILLFMLPPFLTVVNFFKHIKKASVAIEQLQLLQFNAKEVEKSEMPITKDHAPLIQLLDVRYLYQGSDPFEVGPFTMDIYNNEILLIKGGNGSGKTTLSKLIVGLYTPKEGTIKFQNTPVTDQLLESYRNKFSAVFADFHVYKDLSYIAKEKAQERVRQYLEMLELTEKVEVSDDLKLSDINLSYGQMGRLNLLRALVEDRDIYVFDEWAANQDPYFKEKFYREIIPELKSIGKTVILISHDAKYFDVADRVVTLADGELQLG